MSHGELTTPKQSHREKPFQCPFCKKAFTIFDNLTVHIRNHTREKAFPYSFCQKTFAQPGNLGMHKRSHSGEKLFQ